MKSANFYSLLGLGFLTLLFLARIFWANLQPPPSSKGVTSSLLINSEIIQAYPKVTYLPIKFSPPADQSPRLAPPELKAKSALLFDLTTDKVLWEKNPEEKLMIASLTKLMTALVALENFTGERDDRFFILDDDLKTENSYSDLKPGDNFSFIELLHLLLIRSDNVAATVLAKAVAGEETTFVLKMNQKANTLGMKNTLFFDSTGLKTNLSTAKDLLILTKEILRSQPEIFSISKLNELTIVSPNKKVFKIKNTNLLIDKIPGLIGSKTGFTPEALGSLLIVFDFNQKKILSLVLGSPDRFGDAWALINWYWRLNSANINQELRD